MSTTITNSFEISRKICKNGNSYLLRVRVFECFKRFQDVGEDVKDYLRQARLYSSKMDNNMEQIGNLVRAMVEILTGKKCVAK